MTTDTGVIADMTITETTPAPFTDLPIAASCVTEAPVHTATTGTLPTADLLLTATPPKMTADPDITPDIASTNQPEDHWQQHRHHLANMRTGNRNINRLLLMIHLWNITAQTTVKLTLKMI